MKLDAVLITLIVFGVFYLILELFARRGERKMLIQKIQDIKSNDAISLLSPYLPRFGRVSSSSKRSYWAVRVGIVGVFVGAGMIGIHIIEQIYFPFVIDHSYRAPSFSNTFIPPTICLFGGLGFLVSAFVERKLAKYDREAEQEEEHRQQSA